MAMPPQLVAALERRKAGNGPSAMQSAAAQKLVSKSEPMGKGRFQPKKKKPVMAAADTDKDGM